ncbi:MAG: T9SS type A sorting domain-containing protein [Bacteroidetes bacterium]|nr:T9SS type A sorting domain-containing protein [Bacteroidota bacterium]MBP6640435.1 T9SS type A sorting domain-containing protein [Bacteroidia bacterium]
MKKFFPYSSVTLVLTISFIVIFAANLTFSNLVAQCTVIGTGNTTGNVNYGSSNNWANPNRANLSDDLYARVQLANGEVSKYLQVSDYGYMIPPGATIDGIQVSIEGFQESFLADFADASIVLTKAGVPVGIDHAGTGYYDDKDYVNIYGSNTDLWGESWTPADIMDPGFGVLYSVTRRSGSGTYYMNVDYVEVTVFFSGDGCLLPVTYRTFDAALNDDHSVRLDWTTESETDNSLFNIERSHDGVHYSKIGSLEASGGTAAAKAYNFNDHQILEGTAYYRLQQQDLNGSSAYSEVRMVTAADDDGFEISAFPNPVATQLTVSGNTLGTTAKLFDVTGKLVLQQSLDDRSTIDVATMEQGVYLLQVSDGRQSRNLRVLVQ